MKSKVILSVLGSDKPGLTQRLADAVFAAEGNWLESHLSHLGGKYVGSVLVELERDNLPALEARVAAVDAAGLHVSIVAADDDETVAGEPVVVALVGQDRPGIVLELTTALTGIGANIEDFTTSTEGSAWSGSQLFRGSARLTLPEGLSAERVREVLENVSNEIMVDITVSNEA